MLKQMSILWISIHCLVVKDGRMMERDGSTRQNRETGEKGHAKDWKENIIRGHTQAGSGGIEIQNDRGSDDDPLGIRCVPKGEPSTIPKQGFKIKGLNHCIFPDWPKSPIIHYAGQLSCRNISLPTLKGCFEITQSPALGMLRLIARKIRYIRYVGLCF